MATIDQSAKVSSSECEEDIPTTSSMCTFDQRYAIPRPIEEDETLPFNLEIPISISSDEEDHEDVMFLREKQTSREGALLMNVNTNRSSMSSLPSDLSYSTPVRVKLLRRDARIPKKATKASAGFDIYSVDECVLKPRDVIQVPTGIALDIPEEYYGQLCSRSGLAMIKNLMVIPGVIDADYRGEIGVMMYNMGKRVVRLKAQVRIAQLIIQKIHPANELLPVTELEVTDRGENGFGHTGLL